MYESFKIVVSCAVGVMEEVKVEASCLLCVD